MALNSHKPGLSAKQLKAALLVGEDSMSVARIAEECGVSERIIHKWKLNPEFMDAVRQKVRELDEATSQFRFAKRRGRIAALEQMAEDHLTIMAERAAWFAENDPEVPGGRTGRIIKRIKVIGVGKNSTQVTEYEEDKGLDSNFRDTIKQIAQERGEWSDKKEVSGPNGMPLLPIIELRIREPEPVKDDPDAEDAAP